MARDLTAAWEFLNAVTRARERLASARPAIWEKARLPTAEHMAVLRIVPEVNPSRPGNGPDAEHIAIRVSLDTHLKDGRRLISCVDVSASPRRWRVQPYITLTDSGDSLFWEGQALERDDSSGFADAVDAATNGLLDATLSLDFAALEER
jgi:hypothetical protein